MSIQWFLVPMLPFDFIGVEDCFVGLMCVRSILDFYFFDGFASFEGVITEVGMVLSMIYHFCKIVEGFGVEKEDRLFIVETTVSIVLKLLMKW